MVRPSVLGYLDSTLYHGHAEMGMDLSDEISCVGQAVRTICFV